VTLAHQRIRQRRHDPLGSPIQLRWNAFGEGRHLRDSQCAT
jgi:hypothetical protein